MARPLIPRTIDRGDRRALLVTLAVVLLLHALAIAFFSQFLQAPSLLAHMTAPMYTRTISVQAPAPEPAAQAPMAEAAPERPTARIETPQQAARRKAARPPPPRAAASQAQAATERPAPAPPEAPEAAASQAVAAAPAAEPAGPVDGASAALAAASAPAPTQAAASAAAPAYLAQWPADTRLTYRLGGNYRGELHGSAQVLWQREGTRYQASVQIDLGLLLSMRFTSQGEITEQGLAPEVYEEQVRQRRRGVRIGEDVRLNNGERVPRPRDVQDTASQFVEMGHRFATDPAALQAGSEIRLWLARPGGVDQWTYDVVGEDTLHLPRLGAVPAYHLKPRPLDKPRGPISAEIWIAPTLQYLPVRIRLTQGPDTYMDLMVETIEQQ
ncbi:MAG: DUF3108 domain-containing protein [Proteobacteria bacterium]|nr:DUF3108 domain-containing protein [Pseudomonadota bacterium]